MNTAYDADQSIVLKVKVLIQPGARLSELSTVCDAISGLGEHVPGVSYELVSEKGGEITVAGGLKLSTSPAHFEPLPGLLVIVGTQSGRLDTKSTALVFSKATRQAWRVLVLSEAIGALLRERCLEGRDICLPWTDPHNFDPTQDHSSARQFIYRTDRRVTTSVGRASTIHALLHVITEIYGRPLAYKLAEQLHVGYIRSPNAFQRLAISDRYQIEDPRLVKMLEIFEERLDDQISIQDTAGSLGLSSRQLERLSKRFLGTSPKNMLYHLRAMKARWMLEATAMPITDIAFACGYSGASIMSRHIGRKFGSTPSDIRQTAFSDPISSKGGADR